MPTAVPVPFHIKQKERQAKRQGIDLTLAYRALIRGFIRAKTTRQLGTATTEQEKAEG